MWWRFRDEPCNLDRQFDAKLSVSTVWSRLFSCCGGRECPGMFGSYLWLLWLHNQVPVILLRICLQFTCNWSRHPPITSRTLGSFLNLIPGSEDSIGEQLFRSGGNILQYSDSCSTRRYTLEMFHCDYAYRTFNPNRSFQRGHSNVTFDRT